MRKTIIASLLAASAFTFAGCDARLEELNTDVINPQEVSAESLFTRGLKQGFDRMVSINVNNNPFRLYAQYWAQTTYPEESQYNLTSRNIPANFWNSGYRDVLIDLDEAKKLLEAEIASGTSSLSDAELQNRIQLVETISIYTYATLVDAFGNIPYSEALNIEKINPKYDDAATVYADLISRLNAVTSTINVGAGGFPASQDPLYNGDMESWMKFANSLKLRMGMRLADVNPSLSVSTVNSAIAGGVFTSNADNASLPYMAASPNTNPVYEDLVLSGRNDFVLANTLANKMNELRDPRLFAYAQLYSTSSTDPLARGTFVMYDDGLTYLEAGSVLNLDKNPRIFKGGTYGTANSFNSNSKVSAELYNNPTFEGTILNYAEVEFLLAEAVARGGYSASGTAAEHYHTGIRASFDQWGVDGAEEYISQPTINYATASGTFKEKIGLQLWLALYNQGFEAWNTWKRYDFGVMSPLPGDSEVSIPLRFTYPIAEQQLNGTNYAAAGSAIGGDEVTTKLFWDVN